MAAILVGLGSSSHCLGMCGGIAAGFAVRDSRRKLAETLLFNFGRLLSYSILGAITGLLVSAISLQMTSLQFGIRIFAGLMLVAMGLYLSGWWLGLTKLEKLALPLWLKIQPIVRKVQGREGISNALCLGLLWGFLPCGLIYSTLVWASASGSAISSATLMFFMGVGTLPALLFAAFMGSRIVQSPRIRRFSGLLLIFYGIWTALVPVEHLLMHSDEKMSEMRPNKIIT